MSTQNNLCMCVCVCVCVCERERERERGIHYYTKLHRLRCIEMESKIADNSCSIYLKL